METKAKEVQNKCNELWNTIQQTFAQKKEISRMLSEHVEANRKFAVGDIVIICNQDTDAEVGRGVVGGAASFVGLDPLYLKSYTDDKAFERDFDYIGYEIFALKKDGTQSTKHFFQIPHFISDTKRFADYYIKKA